MELAAESEHRPVHDFFQANLAAFKKSAPHLYSRLSTIQRPNTELIADQENGIDIGFRGQKLYGRDAVDYANAQLERFFRAPVREYINEPDPTKLRGMTGDFCQALTRRMADRKIEYDPNQTFPDSHFLLILGIGLGLHIPTLIERIGARVVILVEPHIEFLYQSLYVTDWAAIFDEAAERGVRFSFIVEKSVTTIGARASQALRSGNPALLDGVTFYTDYRSAILDQARDRIKRDLFLSLSGLGYFDDEIIMCRNAVGNLGSGSTHILGDYLLDRDVPLFIVGSGPSVEGDLDFIAEHADKVALISIGTGLRTLLERGIRPDFHVELENGLWTRDILAVTGAEFGLDGITLLASTTVHPEASKLFDRVVFFFRERVTPTEIFAGSFKVLQPAGPTVANSALIAAIHLGFREIYLFGVDMGTKVEGKFHAKSSVYGVGLMEDRAKPTQTFPANFGGTATGSHIFDWSRKVLENTLAYYRTVDVYNCSDGVLIEGALPKVSRAISLPEAPIDRDKFYADISQGLARCEPELWRERWVQRQMRVEAERTFVELDQIFADAAASAAPDMDWVHDVCDVMGALDRDCRAMASYLRGTLLISIGCVSWYERRIADEDQRREFRTIAIEEYRTMVDEIQRCLAEQFDQMDAALSQESGHA